MENPPCNPPSQSNVWAIKQREIASARPAIWFYSRSLDFILRFMVHIFIYAVLRVLEEFPVRFFLSSPSLKRRRTVNWFPLAAAAAASHEPWMNKSNSNNNNKITSHEHPRGIVSRNDLMPVCLAEFWVGESGLTTCSALPWHLLKCGNRGLMNVNKVVEAINKSILLEEWCRKRVMLKIKLQDFN